MCVEKPILTNINGSTVTFKDGTKADYDVIIKCTGYQHSFPFLSKGNQMSYLSLLTSFNLELMLKATNQLCPTGLYNQCVSLQNEKLFFIGMADQFYTFTMFQLQVIMNAKIYHDFVSIESLF